MTAASAQAGERGNPAALNAHAQEPSDAPAHEQPADDPRRPADRALPYDPEDWERRLAVARVRREKVLKQRTEERQRAAAHPEPGATAAGAGDRQLRSSTAPLGDAPAAGQANGPQAASAQVAADGSQAGPQSRRSAGRLRPVMFGLLVGCVAGASLASFGDFGPGIAEMRSRLSALSPIATSPSLEAAPSYVATLPPLQPPRRASPIDESAIAAPAVPAPAASEPIAELRVPSTPAAPPPALTAPVRLADPSADFSAPKELQAPPSDPQPRIARPASDTAHASADRGLSAPSSLAVLHMSRSTYAPVAPLAPPQSQVSRVVVHAPVGVTSDRRAWALERLSERGWPIEQATTPYTIGETHVRYYHRRDRAAAQDLAALLDAAARDFTNFSPPPEEGLLELWLGGEGAPPQEPPVRTRVVAPPAVASVPPAPAPAPTPGIFGRIANIFSGASGGEGRGFSRGSSSSTDRYGGGAEPQPSAPDAGGESPSSGTPQAGPGARGQASTGGDSDASGGGADGGNTGAPSASGASGNQGSGDTNGGQGSGGASGSQGSGGGSGNQGSGGGSGGQGSGRGSGDEGSGESSESQGSGSGSGDRDSGNSEDRGSSGKRDNDGNRGKSGDRGGSSADNNGGGKGNNGSKGNNGGGKGNNGGGKGNSGGGKGNSGGGGGRGDRGR